MLTAGLRPRSPGQRIVRRGGGGEHGGRAGRLTPHLRAAGWAAGHTLSLGHDDKPAPHSHEDKRLLGSRPLPAPGRQGRLR